MNTGTAVLRSHTRECSASTGSVAVALAAVAFSTAGLFTRVIVVDVWTMLFWRGLFGGLLIAAYIAWRERGRMLAAFASIGLPGVAIASCSALGTICFITALRATTVADVTIIYATAPFIAAAIGWASSGERLSRTTLAASSLALLGVIVMCGAAVTTGNVLGDLLALTMTVLMAVMMVLIRRNRRVSMLPATCLSAFACALAVLPLADPTDVTTGDLFWLGLFGTTQFGLGLLLLTIGSRLVSATRASLLANLELPFAPLWVWLVYDEVPSETTCIGGAIVLIAVLLDLTASQVQVSWTTRRRWKSPARRYG